MGGKGVDLHALSARSKGGWDGANRLASYARAKPKCGRRKLLTDASYGYSLLFGAPGRNKPPDVRRGVVPGPGRPTFQHLELQDMENKASSTTDMLRRGAREQRRASRSGSHSHASPSQPWEGYCVHVTSRNEWHDGVSAADSPASKPRSFGLCNPGRTIACSSHCPLQDETKFRCTVAPLVVPSDRYCTVGLRMWVRCASYGRVEMASAVQRG